MKEMFKSIALASSAVLLSCAALSAQNGGAYGAYAPYSIYGVGDRAKDGTAFNRSMGGVGIATRNRRFINTMNPAAVTARDSLAFMADFGLYEDNKIYAQGKFRSAKNTFNVNDLVMSFPIWRSSAFLVGITPFSDVGYDFSSKETDGNIIADTGAINYSSYGNGSIYQAFASAGVTFWKRLSVGAEAICYFGNLDKVSNVIYSNSTYKSINAGHELSVRGFTGKFGLQYDQKIAGDVAMTVGATYRLATNIRGNAGNYIYATMSSVTDTIRNESLSLKGSGLKIGDELGVGLAVKGGERWSVEFNYLRSDWRNSGFENVRGFASDSYDAATGTGYRFTSGVAHSFRAGFEFVPNRNDIRYYMRRCAYRGGVYYDIDHFLVNGHRIDGFGLTFGVTLPVFRWYNGITLGVDLGQRGTKNNGLIRERYAKFVIGLNIHDIWFQKPKYN